LELEMTDKCWF